MVGQAAVLCCGSLWIGYKFKMGFRGTLDAGCLPFLPGLLVKSMLTGVVAVASEEKLKSLFGDADSGWPRCLFCSE